MPTVTARGTAQLQGDGSQQVWYIDHDEVDTNYTPILMVQNAPRDANNEIIPWELGNFTTSGFRIIFSSPPPGLTPAFNVLWIIVRDS